MSNGVDVLPNSRSHSHLTTNLPEYGNDLGDANVAKGTLAVYIERVAITAISLIVSVVLVRHLRPSDFGLYKLALGAVTFAAYATSFGLEAIVSRFVPEFRVSGSRQRITHLVNLAVAVRVASLLVLLAFLYGFRNRAGEFFDATRLFQNYYLPVAGMLVLQLMSRLIGSAVLVGYSLRYVDAYVRIGANLFRLLGVSTVLLMGHDVGSVFFVLLGVAFAEFVAYLVIVSPKLAKNVRFNNLTGNPSQRLPLRSIASFGMYNHLWQSGQVLREFAVDNYVISATLGVTHVAYYGVASVLPTLLYAFTPGRILYGVMLPELVKRFTLRQSYVELGAWYRLMQKLNLLVVLPLILFLLLFTSDLLPWAYGTTYRVSAYPALILVAFSLLTALTSPFYMLAQVIKKPQLVFYSSIWGVYNLVMDLLLIPVWGITGAAWATGTSAAFLFLHFYLGSRFLLKLPVSFPWAATVRILINLLPFWLCLLVAKQLGLSHLSGIAMLLIAGLSYLGMNAVHKILDPRERHAIEQQLGITIPFA